MDMKVIDSKTSTFLQLAQFVLGRLAQLESSDFPHKHARLGFYLFCLSPPLGSFMEQREKIALMTGDTISKRKRRYQEVRHVSILSTRGAKSLMLGLSAWFDQGGKPKVSGGESTNPTI